MTTYYKNATELIGRTPLLRLSKFAGAVGITDGLFAKLEGMNLTGSMKDRIALAMIEAAEEDGRLKPGGTIIEPTSGNTGIGLSALGAAKGYRVVIVMPDTMTIERRKLMQVYGAELVLTPGAKGMTGAIQEAERLLKESDNAIIAGQFENPVNPKIHYDSTGPEIWQDMSEKVDVLVAGVGTGGSLSGVGRFLKDQQPSIQVVAVEPDASAVLSGDASGPHGLQGIGAGFVPSNLDTSVIDRVMRVKDDDAWDMVRMLAKTEGLFAGVSSGAALDAAVRYMKENGQADTQVAVILPDTGLRYLSSPGLLPEE